MKAGWRWWRHLRHVRGSWQARSSLRILLQSVEAEVSLGSTLSCDLRKALPTDWSPVRVARKLTSWRQVRHSHGAWQVSSSLLIGCCWRERWQWLRNETWLNLEEKREIRNSSQNWECQSRNAEALQKLKRFLDLKMSCRGVQLDCHDMMVR